MVSMMSLATPTSEAGRAMVGACVYKQEQKSYNTTQPKRIFSIELGPILNTCLIHQGLLNEGIREQSYGLD